MSTSAIHLVSAAESRDRTVGAATNAVDEMDAAGGNYAVAVVPLRVLHATEASANDVKALTAALRAVLDIGPCLRGENDTPMEASHADGWDNARAAMRAAADAAIAAND